LPAALHFSNKNCKKVSLAAQQKGSPCAATPTKNATQCPLFSAAAFNESLPPK